MHRSMDYALRSELIAMDEHDQAVRAELAADGSLFNGYHPKMTVVHDASNVIPLRTRRRWTNNVLLWDCRRWQN